VPLLAALSALLAPGRLAAQTASTPCQFVLGFKTLHDLDPADVGDCTENQSPQPNGDAQQHTTNGLMVWRKADNWTAFTNGYMTWINGPSGLASRLNTDRFSWEAPATALALAPATVLPAPSPTATAKPTTPWYIKRVSDRPIQMCGYGGTFACVDSAPNPQYQYVSGHVIYKDGTPASGFIVQANVGSDPNSPKLFNTTTADGQFGIVFGIGCATGPLTLDVYLVDANLKLASDVKHIQYLDCRTAGEFHFDFMENGSPNS